MAKGKAALAVATLVLAGHSSGAVQSLFTPIDISPVANSAYETTPLFANGDTYPTGDLVLGGVPFTIPPSGNSIWNSEYAPGGNPRSVDIGINVFGAETVFTLISTIWGEKEPGTFAFIEFFGDVDAYYRYDLDGNVDIRDYNLNDQFTTAISGITTEVWNNVDLLGYVPLSQHLDMQTFNLPESFSDETLASIRLTDNGASYFQRAFIGGVTVQSVVPEPAFLSLLGLGALALIIARKRV